MKTASPILPALLMVMCGNLFVACKQSSEGGEKSASQPAAVPAPAPQAPAPQAPAPAAPPQAPAQPAPAQTAAASPAGSMDFSLPIQPVSDPPITFTAYRGKPVLLFYFGPTCPHCQAATPEIQAFADEIRPKGVETLAIANMRSNPQEIREFISKYHVKVPVYWDTERKFGEAYNVKSLPTIYLVGKAGEVFRLDNYSGKASLDLLRARI